MLCALILCAVQTVGVMTVSAHTHGGFESVTPGVYAVTPEGYTVGVYNNSHGKASAFAGRQFETKSMSEFAGLYFGLLLGGVAGYGKPSPLVVPSVAKRIAFTENAKLRLSYIPQHPSKPNGSDALHLSIEWSIK